MWWNFIYVPLKSQCKIHVFCCSINFIFSWNYTLPCTITTSPHTWLFHFKQPLFIARAENAVQNKMTSCSFSAIRPVYNSTYVMKLHAPPVQNHWSRSLQINRCTWLRVQAVTNKMPKTENALQQGIYIPISYLNIPL